MGLVQCIGLPRGGGINGPGTDYSVYVDNGVAVLMDLQCIRLPRGGGINGHSSVHAYHGVAVLTGILVYRPTMGWRY